MNDVDDLIRMKREMKFGCYFDEELDGRYHVGLRPGMRDEEHILIDWCEENVGDHDIHWGFEWDEFYSHLCSGMMYWYADEASRLCFRLRWAPL